MKVCQYNHIVLSRECNYCHCNWLPSPIKESKFDLYFTEQEAIQSFDLILMIFKKEERWKELEKNSNSNNKGGEESASDKKTKQQKLQVLTPEEKYGKMNIANDIIASIERTVAVI